MKIKTLIQHIIFLLLLCGAALYFVFGKKGIRSYVSLKQEFDQEKERVVNLEQEIEQINQTIKKWQKDSFEKERIARQDLSMSFTNELVYLTPAKNL